MTLDWDGGGGQNHCQVSRRERPWWGKIGAGHSRWDLKHISKLEEEGDSWFNAFSVGNKLGILYIIFL